MAHVTRRDFLRMGAMSVPVALMARGLCAEESAVALPVGRAPRALEFDWFPTRVHAFVWRNWGLVRRKRIAAVIGAKERDVERLGRGMGLEVGRELNDAERRRAGLTIIRRNWHLLPYEQLLELLGWTAEEMAYTLREDDFFFVKLGLLKPKCERLRWEEIQASLPRLRHEEELIRGFVREAFPHAKLEGEDRLFGFE